MKKILFTGGAGFIGSHIVEKYIELNHEVIIVDNFSSGKMSNLNNVVNSPLCHIENCDITNVEELEKVFIKYQPTVINHHAAQKSVSYSVENPIYNAMINEIGLLNLITLGVKYKIDKFIYVSSGGALSKEILNDEKSCENDIPQLKSPYAITKYCGEHYLRNYSELYGFSWIGLRYANAYGPRQIADGECGVIPIFLNNLFAQKESILFTYEDMPRGCTRDYIYINDIVDFNVLALNTDKGLNDVYNIGSGIELPILDIYDELIKVFETNIPIRIAGPRLGDIKRSVLDTAKAQRIFGWKPTFTLSTGLNDLKKNYNK